jgi:hypothetical protein
VNAHLLTCAHNHEFNKSSRHHFVLRQMRDTCTRFHIAYTSEPTSISKALRPDA